MILRLILFTLLAVASAKISSAQQARPTPTIGSTFDPVQATNAWLATVPADKRAKSDAYFEGGYWLLLWNFLAGAAISIFLLASTFLAQLRDFWERLTGSKTLKVVLYAISYIRVL